MNQQKKSKKKTIIIVVVVLVLLGAALSSKNDKKEEETTTTSTTEQTGDNTQNDSDSKGSGDKTTFGVGEAAELEGVSVCVKKVESSKGNDWGKPAKGKKFVFLKILVENNSEDDVIISSMASFDAYCDDFKLDYSSEALLALSVDKNKQSLDGTVASGKKLEGYLGFEVPKKWENIELHYIDNVWFGDKVKFLIKNK